MKESDSLRNQIDSKNSELQSTQFKIEEQDAIIAKAQQTRDFWVKDLEDKRRELDDLQQRLEAALKQEQEEVEAKQRRRAAQLLIATTDDHDNS
ncbi:MAG: hypothetical protein WAU02_03010 [Candidatus Saccharimonadales bacterium]